MQERRIELAAVVETQREDAMRKARDAADALFAWITGPALEDPLHSVDQELMKRLLALGACLISLWLAHRVPVAVPESLRRGRAWYRFESLGVAEVRTGFGVVWWRRPVYGLSYGVGPRAIAPADRDVGLAAGRMSLGVHLVVANLAARMPFGAAKEVIEMFGSYAPSTRSMHGIVDRLGPQASRYLRDLPAPDDDGEILVIEDDAKGAPHMSPDEHAKRCKPHTKRGRGADRAERRARRRKSKRVRKKTGDKSKNKRMASVGVVYTLRRLPDGAVEGPINRRVFGTFEGPRKLAEILLNEAKKRGYGKKETIFLADGASNLWSIHKEFFPDATPCLDWYHLGEYLWAAGSAVYAQGSSDLRDWVRARQDELVSGAVDDVLSAIRALKAQVGKSGPGTKGRRKKIKKALRYIENHREMMPYGDLIERGLVYATGCVEGAIKHIGARLDGCGMRWSVERSEHILALRCVLASREWSGFADAVIAEHEEVDDWAVERITPRQRQTPHKAKRKAA